MNLRTFIAMCLCALLISCATSQLVENASVNYKTTKDYKSLETIYNYLMENRTRHEAHRLLGTPDDSPHVGVHHYASNHSKFSIAQNQHVLYGLIVDYRDKNGMVTEIIQALWLGPMVE